MANGRLPRPDAYRNALEASRARFRTARQDEARRIVSSLRAYVTGLTRRLEGEIGAGFTEVREGELRRARELNEAAARDLLERLEDGTEEARASLFEDTLELWRRSGREAASQLGFDLASLRAVRPPPATLLGAYESIGAAQSWRTLLRGHVSDAATEANAIVRGAMAEGVGVNELASRMRRYVVGSEAFDDVFTEVPTLTGDVKKLDLRRVPASARGAARQVRFNSMRIAWSEMRNARHEAELQHFWRDPLVDGILWRLSPTHTDTDSCDLLASADWYGLGPGVYPIGKVPAPPHPMDGCENQSVMRPGRQVGDPKPDPGLARTPSTGDVPGRSGMTENRTERIAQEARDALERGERALRDRIPR